MTMEERYVASLVLAAAADAIGYRNSDWEFCGSGPAIHAQLQDLGGLENLSVEGWSVSDASVLLLATAEALARAEGAPSPESFPELMASVASSYVACWPEMSGRAPGNTCTKSVKWLRTHPWYTVPYSSTSTGCGAAIRSSAVGLALPLDTALEPTSASD
eukprot:RCo044702